MEQFQLKWNPKKVFYLAREVFNTFMQLSFIKLNYFFYEDEHFRKFEKPEGLICNWKFLFLSFADFSLSSS
jgi:hypothetical protein